VTANAPSGRRPAVAAVREHWPEYLMEGAELGLFMLSACLFSALLFHPGSGASAWPPFLRMALMGLAMAATAVAIVYSPLGRRSGAHFNPSVTLTYLRLGRIAPWDAAFYVLAQFAGGVAGVLVAEALLGDVIAHPQVRYAVTEPGAHGAAAAFAAEVAMSFALMSTVLLVSNQPRLSRFTPLFTGALLALYITFEAPISGMSMNPARTVASALPAGVWHGWWIYFSAPPLGMLLAAEAYLRLRGWQRVYCAKLVHDQTSPCPFVCRWHASVAPIQSGGALALALLLLFCQPAQAQLATRVDGVGLTVSDLDRSLDFYTRVLGFERVAETEVTGEAHERLDGLFGVRKRVARLRLGDEEIALTEYLAPRGRPAPVDARSDDHWFQHLALVVRDMDEAYRHLRAHRVEHASSGPQRLPDWNPSAGGIEAFYFKDPDGHALEAIHFPPGKGEPRWQKPGAALFLGIDHTAIVVADTERSLAFYRDLLGLRVAGESENWGSEQEHLNNVFGARLRITGLRAAAGPGIELLEYLAPRRGRPVPADAGANDLTHGQTRLITHDAEEAADAARAGRFEWVSPGAVRLPDTALGYRAGVSLRDPTGHVVQLVEP